MKKKIFVITSGGGHWEQMMLLRESFVDCQVIYANTIDGLAEKSKAFPNFLVTDCNRDRPMDTLRCIRDVTKIIYRERPDFVITTGAAPGFFALLIGKIFGAKAIWIDSVANSEQLSLSGKLSGWIADLWLTQWEHLSTPKGPKYYGSVL
jgi:UDP-N-acetylglucosamine:LPS N-acetylglucosamine transferase